jgi:two-component system, response regulator
MVSINNNVPILMADDDPDDQMLLMEALKENNVSNAVSFVENGEELMDYLNKRGKFSDESTQTPGIILLDLNMPKIDGREALRMIKSDKKLLKIPVVVLSTSRADADVIDCYNLGVNSFISKPVRFEDLVAVTKELTSYWLGAVTLPK